MSSCAAEASQCAADYRNPRHRQTTIIRRVAERLGRIALRGFYTEELRERGERRGFRLVGFNGRARIIAHVDFPKRHRVGKYGVDVQALDEAAALLRPDPDVRAYLVDEIGKMECLPERIVAAMRALIAGSTPVVASVGARGGGFIAEVKRGPGSRLMRRVCPSQSSLRAQELLPYARAGMCPNVASQSA